MKKEKKINNFLKEVKNIMLKIIKIFIIIYLIGIFLISWDGLITFNNQNKGKYAIVYGSKIMKNGEVSDRLKARLDKAIELFNNKKVEKIIVSGGIGETGFNEAVVMKKYLINKGIKIPRILIDRNGNTTKLTSINSYNIVKNKGDYPNIGIIGVTQFFHCSRVKLSLKKSGFSNVSCASPEYYEMRDIYSIIREIPAYIKYFFMGIETIDIDKKDLEKIGNKIGNKIGKKVLEKIGE